VSRHGYVPHGQRKRQTEYAEREQRRLEAEPRRKER